MPHDDDIQTYAAAAAARLGLAIPAASMPRVAAFLKLAQSMAELVEESGALRSEESAAVFRLRDMP